MIEGKIYTTIEENESVNKIKVWDIMTSLVVSYAPFSSPLHSHVLPSGSSITKYIGKGREELAAVFRNFKKATRVL